MMKMDIQKIKDTIRLLSKPSFGSFGEYLFKSTYKNKNEINPKHKNRTDFMINNQSIDVKSRRFLNETYKKVYVYKSNEFKHIDYPTVVFYTDCVVVSYKDFIVKLDYNTLETYYNNWIVDRKKKPTIVNKDVDKYEIEWKKIQFKLDLFLKLKYRIDSYILKRTKDWGKNSPHNLLPIYTKNKKKRLIPKNQLRVFIQFNDYRISEDNIKWIIAYNEKDYKKLFKILSVKKAPLSNGDWKKVDMTKIPKQIKYNNLDELKQNLKL